MLLVKTLSAQYVAIFVIGLSQPVKSMIAYTHLMEFMTDRESKISGTFMCIDGMVYVISPIINVYITNDMNFYIGVSIALLVIALIMFIALRIPESLKFLLVNGKLRQFWVAHKAINTFNKASDKDLAKLRQLVDSFKREEKAGTKGKEGGQWRRFMYNLMMMFLAWSAMSFGINLLNFYTKHLPGDVYTNSTVIGFASLSYVLAGPLGIRMPTKHILSASYMVALAGSIGILTMMQTTDGDFLSTMVFLTRCGLNMAFCFIFIIHTELFPTFFLATSYGLCSFVGRSLTLTAPLIAES
jgi:MFS family permease